MIFAEYDTIAAMATPAGEGGISVIRISGKNAIPIVDQIFIGRQPLVTSESHRLFHGWIMEGKEPIDEVVAALYKGPGSYTGEDMVEISCHGGGFVSRRILELAVKKGVRPAEPGEFTKRAFINGKIDLSQAEAIADIVRAKTESSRKVAVYQLKGSLSKRVHSLKEKLVQICSGLELELDFGEENMVFVPREALKAQLHSIKIEMDEFIRSFDRGRLCREGLRAVIVGKPNVGKSSLLNALLEKERAIVTEHPGTTRDTVEDVMDLEGLQLKLTDTAGMRKTDDPIEIQGVRRTEQALETADLILFVIDGSRDMTVEDDQLMQILIETGKKILCIINKTDLIRKKDNLLWIEKLKPLSKEQEPIEISALTGKNIDKLIQNILNSVLVGGAPHSDEILLTNTRQRNAFLNAKNKITKTEESLKNGMSQEFIAMDIRGAMDDLEEIAGKTTPDDILEKIFSEFCIGK